MPPHTILWFENQQSQIRVYAVTQTLAAIANALQILLHSKAYDLQC